MDLIALIEIVVATVTASVLTFVFRYRLTPAVIVINRWLAELLRRPNPNGNWQDAYAPHCKRCGYDLRASPTHCPECGEPVPAYERTIIHYLIKLGDKPPRSDAK